MTLVGRAAEPLDRLDIILRHAVPVGVQESQERLRSRVAVLRERLQLPEGRGIVLPRESVQRLLCPSPPGDDGEPEHQPHPQHGGQELLSLSRCSHCSSLSYTTSFPVSTHHHSPFAPSLAWRRRRQEYN